MSGCGDDSGSARDAGVDICVSGCVEGMMMDVLLLTACAWLKCSVLCKFWRLSSCKVGMMAIALSVLLLMMLALVMV